MIKKLITYTNGKFKFTFEPIEESITINKIKDKYEVKYLTYDECPESPRTSWDNLGKMVCFHKRYNLGDSNNLTSDSFNSWEELHDYLINYHDAIVILPIYMLDHSGITISVNSFNDRWDSGQVGFIYANREDIKKEFIVKYITKKTINQVKKILLAEIDVYDKYLRGECYIIAREIYDENKVNLNYDSYSGFCGYENALKELKDSEF